MDFVPPAVAVLSILKVGLGPSSSHTLGPMVMGNRFVDSLEQANQVGAVAHLKITLYGSLSLTGRGHLTDVAVVLGLSGLRPSSTTTQDIHNTMEQVKTHKQLNLGGQHSIPFDMQSITFSTEFLSEHENGLMLQAFDKGNGMLLEKVYFSVGGGFVVGREEFSVQKTPSQQGEKILYDYHSAEELMQMCIKENLTIDELALKRDSQFVSEKDVDAYLAHIDAVMKDAMMAGLDESMERDVLPGPLQLRRRAPSLYKVLQRDEKEGTITKDHLCVLDWIGLFAMAVNEESAAGHRVVTAPTNGSCGVVPAVLAYYRKFHSELDTLGIRKFLLTACAIGYLYRENASISGAEAGCQAEIGVSSSMAAAGLCALYGGSISQIFSAAEIAMEHHLGMTCDPVGQVVQIPCIERNAFGATKAVTAARMALKRTDNPMVSLDEVIETMRATGKDMARGYRETSLAGLAINVGKGRFCC